MSSEMKKYAKFAESSYSMINDGIKSRDERKSATKDTLPPDWDLLSGSTSKRSVFINEKEKEIVISHRGTNVKDVAKKLGKDVPEEQAGKAAKETKKVVEESDDETEKKRDKKKKDKKDKSDKKDKKEKKSKKAKKEDSDESD